MYDITTNPRTFKKAAISLANHTSPTKLVGSNPLNQAMQISWYSVSNKRSRQNLFEAQTCLLLIRQFEVGPIFVSSLLTVGYWCLCRNKYELQCSHSSRECKTVTRAISFRVKTSAKKEFNMTSEVKYILPVLSVCTTTDSVNFTPVYRTSVIVIVGKRNSWVLQKLQVNERLASSTELVVNSRLVVTAGRCAHLFSRPVSSRMCNMLLLHQCVYKWIFHNFIF